MDSWKAESATDKTTAAPAWAGGLAWMLAILLLCLTVAGLWLIFANRQHVDVWKLIYPGITTIALVYPLVGAFLAAHRPRNPIGWLMMVMGAAGSLSVFAQGCAVYSVARFATPPPTIVLLCWLDTWVWLVSFIVLPLLLLYFPNGRLPGRAWRWVLLLLGLACGMLVGRAITSWPNRANLPILDGSALDAAVDATGGFWGFVLDFSAVMLFAAYLAAIFSLAVRYRRAGTAERLQIKWFAFAGSAAVLVQIGSVVLVPYGGYLAGDWRQILFAVLQAVSFAGIAFAIGIAVLRYRLYDLDVVIRKTLIYSILTLLLAMLYFGSVLLLQQLLITFTNQNSTPAVVASTLLTAALFAPLRQRVQSAIDKRFFRRKYDTQQVLARFAEAARNEVGLDTLTSQLLHVIEETMQPTSVSIWLGTRGQTVSGKYEHFRKMD